MRRMTHNQWATIASLNQNWQKHVTPQNLKWNSYEWNYECWHATVQSCSLFSNYRARLSRIMENISCTHWNTMDPASQVTVCMKMLYKRQLTTTSGGNVSVKDEEGKIWVTPSVGICWMLECQGIDKCNVKTEQVCYILPDETRVGAYKPTSEWKMHFEMYLLWSRVIFVDISKEKQLRRSFILIHQQFLLMLFRIRNRMHKCHRLFSKCLERFQMCLTVFAVETIL